MMGTVIRYRIIWQRTPYGLLPIFNPMNTVTDLITMNMVDRNKDYSKVTREVHYNAYHYKYQEEQ